MMRFLSILILSFALTQTVFAQKPGKGLTPMSDLPVAPAFTLTDSEGKVHKLEDYRGKVIIVNFWATWCPPCRAEMPSMQRAWEQLREEDILMLAINVGQDEEAIFQFTADYPVDFPLLMDQDSAVTGKWPVRGLPSTYVVDTEGRLAYKAIGGREWDDPALLDQVRALKKPATTMTQAAK